MTEYFIFARKSYEQPLELLGSLHFEGDVQAAQTRLLEQARGQFGAEDWIEMIAIPQSAVTQVIPTSDQLFSPNYIFSARASVRPRNEGST